MFAIPPFLISFENCKMNSSDRLPNVYTDTHWVLFFESFENGMRILIHTAPAIVYRCFVHCLSVFLGVAGFALSQFQSHYRWNKPRRWRGRGHRRPGGDGASIAQMYICAACRGNPLTPMPPAGGNLSATLPKDLKTCQLSLHTPKFKYAAKVTQRK